MNVYLALVCFTGCVHSSLQTPQFENAGAMDVTDSLLHVARGYAPFIYHATDPDGGRQDIISNIDFDGDFVGNNNWENFDLYKLRPTVYYAVLQTETHYFISYHLFHPRDWNHFTFWLQDTHENDGENLQVVVRKEDRRVVLLWTQAHYGSDIHVMPWSGIRSGEMEVAGGFQLVDGSGIPSDSGKHVAVFVEAQGHGIYGTLDGSSQVTVYGDGRYSFEEGSGVLFRPALISENVYEPASWNAVDVPYALQSTTALLWPMLAANTLTGDGRLLDGPVELEDSLITVDVPRYYDADRFSGPLGNDRGISPFALDFAFQPPFLGSLFFNPAERYREQLSVPRSWSTAYLDHPFRR
jgi:hypothetical protein